MSQCPAVIKAFSIAFCMSLLAACGGEDTGNSTAPAPASAPTLSFHASSQSVAGGVAVTLEWRTANAAQCVASGAWSGRKSIDGMERLTMPANVTEASRIETFTLLCDGPAGRVRDSRTITVQPATVQPVLAPTVTLSANPVTVASGGLVTFGWSSSNADSCLASGSWSGSKILNGSQPYHLAVNAGLSNRLDTFTLQCTGPGGSTTRSVQVTVQVDPITVAVITGDPGGLSNAMAVADRARTLATQLDQQQQSRFSAIYDGASAEYQAGGSSQWINIANTELAQPLVVGDKGRNLAGLSVAEGGRAAAYGVNVLEQFRSGSSNMAHMPAFKRVLAWLLSGNAGRALPTSLKVGWSGISQASLTGGLAALGITATTPVCDIATDSGCAAAADLLVFGSGGAASAALPDRVLGYLRAGKPVLYLHTNGWGDSESGRQLLPALGLQLGPYAGNYFDVDAVAADRGAAENTLVSSQFRFLLPLLERLAEERFRADYDWSQCSAQNCDNVPGIMDDILAPTKAVGNQLNAFTTSAKKLFAAPNTTLLRLLSLWADVARQQIQYPLSKSGNQTAFQKAVVADAWVTYVRDLGGRQSDLGTFMGATAYNLPVSSSNESLTLTLPSASGFTTIGRLAVPGRALVIELESAGTASVALRINTQRQGSTRWGTSNAYTRPRFLASPAITLIPGQPVQVLSPYGGTLQLAFSQAQPGQTVSLKLRGVAQHPFLDLTAANPDKTGFVLALNGGQFDWAEIKMDGVEVHSRVDKIKEVLTNRYANDVDRYIEEMRELFFADAYQLAGFKLPNHSLPAAVQTYCTAAQWDCTDATIHRMPGTQHINADTYAHCGSGCSGQPYDQTWGLDPRGWGESHELGHNLQVGELKVYSDRSGEVSNQIFPLHKNWRLLRTYADNRENSRVSYQSAFNMIKAGRLEADPIEGAYQRIWGDAAYAVQNGERMAFYTQWVHYWAERTGSAERGWEIYTLLYLHHRQFKSIDWATYKDRLGYGRYASRPGISGNDNLLIALSWLTQRDQRPVFDLWGIRYSAEAAAQVVAHGFNAEPAFFYANTVTNDHSTARKVDMTVADPQWPF